MCGCREDLSISQCVDNHTKGRQRLVDLLSLFQGLSRGASLSNFFGTSQVDKVQVSGFLSPGFVFLWVIVMRKIECERELSAFMSGQPRG
jgi:hypothetical protein